MTIKKRNVTVEGPRGKLHKNLSHLAVSFQHPAKDVIKIEMHHGTRKSAAALRTVRSIISNMVVGVTKGFKYKMRYVYAHFPINVSAQERILSNQTIFKDCLVSETPQILQFIDRRFRVLGQHRSEQGNRPVRG